VNNSSPKISILVPIYGVDKYIECCARSVFEQTYDNIEYIFVDDSSPDHSMDILKRVMEEYPNRKSGINIIRHEHNKGLAAARNTGVDSATGDFILHVDSDDYIDKDLVEKLVLEQIRSNADIVCGGCKVEYSNHVETWAEVLNRNKDVVAQKLIARKLHNNIWGRLIKRSLYKEHNIRVEEGINNSEDYQVIPRLYYYSNTISSVNSSYYHYNKQNVGSYTQARSLKNDMQIIASFDILKNFFWNKGKDYQDALNIGEITLISWGLKHLNKVDEQDKYFSILMNRLDQIDKKYYKEVDILSRFAFKLRNKKAIITFLNIYDKFKR
jgi:glycosyltransferase involved in cell wall biosynthesis